ncbi:hypothetical protein V6N12_054435 [Hibiscus sabdariffa]|uniref:Uncharacterized protein n=1 Tax=Hibiscus sabdariffa TaxID=183260 RepID=A0ABR2D0E5_9ROSI
MNKMGGFNGTTPLLITLSKKDKRGVEWRWSSFFANIMRPNGSPFDLSSLLHSMLCLDLGRLAPNQPGKFDMT